MELMQVYHEAMAKWILARATSGTCEGSEFVFDLIESAIRKEATEILLTPVQESELVRVDFGRLHCYYRQPKITRAQFAYLAIYLVLIGNVAAQEHAPKDYSADQTKGSIICNLEKYAYLTASRLSSSASKASPNQNRKVEKIDASSSAVENVSYSRRRGAVFPEAQLREWAAPVSRIN
jgi:hypothetical protein